MELTTSNVIKRYAMGGSPGAVSENPVKQEKQNKGWRMSCDVGKAMEDLPLSRTAALVPEFTLKDLLLGQKSLMMITIGNSTSSGGSGGITDFRIVSEIYFCIS